MDAGHQSPKLIFEEKKAITLFLWLFYIFYLTYSIFWYIIIPKYTTYGNAQYIKEGLGYWQYIIVLCFLPVSIYFYKKENPYIIKNFIFFGFILIDLIDNLLRYLGTARPFASGNIVELLFILFAPIFVNKKYFWTVSFGIIVKYCFLGIVLQSVDVIIPIGTTIILIAISYVLLIRFFSYIDSLSSAHEELRQKEKLAVIGQMAATIAHEIRNPLASLKGFTQLQQERFPESGTYFPIMIQEIDRIDMIVNDLMYIGKPKATQIEKASMKEILSYTISIMEQQALAQDVVVETIFAEKIPLIDCDERHLKQVFINLLKNAIEAMPEGGIIKIIAQPLGDSKVVVTINDQGCGINNENISKLMVPFYTTKKDGTGLGLVVTHQIIKEHNGELKLESDPGKGTKVMVTLPISQKK